MLNNFTITVFYVDKVVFVFRNINWKRMVLNRNKNIKLEQIMNNLYFFSLNTLFFISINGVVYN